jgi:hypothetical protein
MAPETQVARVEAEGLGIDSSQRRDDPFGPFAAKTGQAKPTQQVQQTKQGVHALLLDHGGRTV